jgi:hypothetical protein
MTRTLALALFGLIVLAGPAVAETLSSNVDLRPGTRIHAYLFSEQQSRELLAIGEYWDAKLGLPECQGPRGVRRLVVAVLAPIVLPDGSPHPTDGTWQWRFERERCGEKKVHNAIFVARSNDRPDVRPYYPGSTVASPRLVHDTMAAASTTASLKITGPGGQRCPQIDVADMTVTQPPRATAAGEWRERWTFQGCGHATAVDIVFTPDPRGGTSYRMEAAK